MVHEINTTVRSWSPDSAGNVQVRRRGFQVVPNFAGTIHSFVGASLPAAMLDCLHFARTPKREDMLKAYLGISRVTELEGLLIVQPYHPMLFRQGALPGPELLMQFWRGTTQAADLEAKWQELEKLASKQQKRLDKMSWHCYACERDLKATSFGAVLDNRKAVQFNSDVLQRVLRRGACRYCVDCLQKRRGIAGGIATKLTLILCTGPCGQEKTESCFPIAQMMTMRKDRDYRRAVCTQCLQSWSVRVKQAKTDSKTTYFCKQCGVSRPAADYDTRTLQNLIVNERVYDAVCLKCDATPINRHKLRSYTCYTCKEDLDTSSFSISRLKNRHKLKCEMCERPPCKICGKRPEKPLRNQNDVVHCATDRGNYRCTECKYPPCDVCKVTKREQRQTNLVDVMPRWTCAACKKQIA